MGPLAGRCIIARCSGVSHEREPSGFLACNVAVLLLRGELICLVLLLIERGVPERNERAERGVVAPYEYVNEGVSERGVPTSTRSVAGLVERALSGLVLAELEARRMRSLC